MAFTRATLSEGRALSDGRDRVILACMQATDAPTQAIADELVLSLGAVTRHLMTTTGRSVFHEVERLGLSLSQVKTLQLMADREPSTLKCDQRRARPLPPRREPGGRRPAQARSGEARGGSRDRRAKRVSLTAKGRRTFESLLELRVAGLRDFVAGLTPEERDALAAGLRPLMAAAGDRRAETRRQAMTAADPAQRRQPPLVDARRRCASPCSWSCWTTRS